MTGRVTADTLRLTAAERRALRVAGLSAADLAALPAEAIVDASGEVIGEERAAFLRGAATMVRAGVSSSLARNELWQLGVRDAADLATRDADQLFFALLDQTSRTSPTYHDMFRLSVYLCSVTNPDPALRDVKTWTRRRLEAGADPVLGYWRRRFGDETKLPATSRDRLVLPTIGVSAPIADGIEIGGEPVFPVRRSEVVAGPGRSYLVGHWMWEGRHGAFVRLEDVRAGDGVRLGGRRFVVTGAEMVSAPYSPPVTPAGVLVLTTKEHLRVGIIGEIHMLRGVERGRMRVVVSAEEIADDSCADWTPRPIRPVRGAY